MSLSKLAPHLLFIFLELGCFIHLTYSLFLASSFCPSSLLYSGYIMLKPTYIELFHDIFSCFNPVCYENLN